MQLRYSLTKPIVQCCTAHRCIHHMNHHIFWLEMSVNLCAGEKWEQVCCMFPSVGAGCSSVTPQLLIRSKRRCGQTSGADTGILSRRLSRYIFRFTFITFNCLLLPWVETPLCCLDVIQLIINVTEERRNIFLCKCRLLLLHNSLSLPRDKMLLCCLDVMMM